jgi:putative addiction module CopG family antidote
LFAIGVSNRTAGTLASLHRERSQAEPRDGHRQTGNDGPLYYPQGRGRSGTLRESWLNMLIHLPAHLKSFVEREVASGRYESEEQVITEALTHFAEGAEPTVTVDEAIAESLAQVARGETIDYTEDFLKRSAERARENARRGRKVRDDVIY